MGEGVRILAWGGFRNVRARQELKKEKEMEEN